METKIKFTKSELEAKCKEFAISEGKADFYGTARIFLTIGYKTEGCLYLLLTWNRGRTRFVDIGELASKLRDCLSRIEPKFKNLENEKLETADFDLKGNDIQIIYNELSKIIGVEYTGASKVMSLYSPHFFVMWDSWIRDEYGFGTTSVDYLRFLRTMQEASQDLDWNYENNEIPLAKAIDEYNYMGISYPAIQKQREKENQRKIEKKEKQKEKKKKLNQALPNIQAVGNGIPRIPLNDIYPGRGL